MSLGVDALAATLLAMGVTPEVAMGSVRLSLGYSNINGEIAAAADILVSAYREASSRQ